MPALFEGTILYMPTTPPGISVTEAHRLLQIQDRTLMKFPEVERVFGKAGRAETATDPAPFSMMETLVELKARDQWRMVPVRYDFLPGFARPFMQRVLPLKRRIAYEELIREMDESLRFPGVRNAWTMPIRARIDMLTTGVRTPVGIKIFGQDLDEIQRIGEEIEKNLQHIRGTRSVYAERTGGGYFIDFDLDRERLARYGISIRRVQMVIMSAIGGNNLSTVIEGRERYSINVRYARELRDDMERLKRVLVSTMGGAQIPLGQLARIVVRTGPAMIRDENGLLAGYVYVDVTDRDVGGYVEEARAHVNSVVKLKTGYTLRWSGQYEYMERVKNRLLTVIPITLALIFILYYFNFKSAESTMMIMLSMPFTAVGGIIGVKLLGYNMSVAVWAGLIEVVGIGAALSALVTTFILEAHKRADYSNSPELLIPAVIEGASRVLRPAIMTCAADIFGLLPSLWATGIGAEFIKRYTVPIIFGLFTGFVLALIVLPLIYVLWRVDLSGHGIRIRISSILSCIKSNITKNKK
jgi:Cu(I)/Ag(I) efflux system membrane protein CusA/SilA